MTESAWDFNFRRCVQVSVIAHLGLLAVLVLRAAFYPSESLQLERAIRVDMVSLPDKGRPVLPPPDAKPEPTKVETVPAPEPVPQPKAEPQKINLNKNKKAQTDALKKLEALSKIEKMMAQNKPAAPAPVKGNVLSPGSSLTGIAQLEHNDYLSLLDQHIKKHWSLPQWLANANLTARVRVFVAENGVVIKKLMIKSSGNTIFDEKVMQTIDQSSPLPPPPMRLSGILLVDGVDLGFPE